MKNLLLTGIFLLFISSMGNTQSVYPYSILGKYGLVDKDGEIVLPPTYDFIDLFEYPYKNKFTKFHNKGSYGILDSKGNVIVKPEHKEIKYHSNGSFAWVNNTEDKSQTIYSLKTDTSLTINNGFKINRVLGDETSFLQVTNKNLDQNIVYDVNLNEIISFKSGFKVILAGKYIFNECPLILLKDQNGNTIKSIDCVGNEISESDYASKYNFIETTDLMFLDYNLSGEIDIEKTINDINNNNSEFSFVEFTMDYNGGVESVIVKKDNKYGLVSTSSEILLPCEYYSLSPANSFIIARNFNLKYGLFNNQGKEIYPIKFAFLNHNIILNNLVYLEIKGYTFYGNLNGKIYKPKDLDLKLD